MKKHDETTIMGARTETREGVLRSEELGIGSGGKVTVRRLHGGRQEGVLEVVVDGGDMEVSILPTRGMGIWWAKYKGKRLFWRSPVREAVHPRHVRLESHGGLGWLAGCCEGMVRCGVGFHGAPGADEIIDDTGKPAMVDLPLHGFVANLPASEVRVAGRRQGGRAVLSVTGVVHEQTAQYDKYRLVARTEVAISGNEIAIHDEVTNTSRERTQPFELLYHINFGGAALGKGSRMVFKGEVVPRDARAAEGLGEHATFSGRKKGFTEQVYFIDLAASAKGKTGTMLVAPRGDFAVYELHDKRELKCFTQWKQMGADEYVTGFEPGTSLPNNRSVEREAGRLEFLTPGETRKFDVVIGAADTKRGIRAMAKCLTDWRERFLFVGFFGGG